MSEPPRASLAAIGGDLTALTSDLATRWKVPGVLIGVIDGSDELRITHGLSDAILRTRLGPDVIFPFASLSKLVTATTVLAAVAEGLLDLDQPLDPLEGVEGWHRTDLTLRDLLSHTTGWASDELGDHGDGDGVLGRAMQAIATLGVDPATRRHWSYSNAALTTAAYVLERRMGTSYEQLARRYVLGPLGMSASTFVGEPAHGPVDLGHVLQPGAPVPLAGSRLFRAMNPYGGLVGTMGDLLALARAHFAGYREMRVPQSRSPGSHEAAGLAWWVRYVEGTAVVSHGGRASGHMPLLVVVPERRLGIAVVPNCGGSAAARLSHEVASWVLERRLALLEPPLPSGIADGTDLTGRYARNRVVREVTVRTIGFELREWRERDPRPESGWGLALAAADRAVVTDGPLAGLRAEFLRDRDGRVAALRFERTGLGWVHFGGRVIPRAS